MRKGKPPVTSDFKILVIDDEIGIIKSIEVLLRRFGYGITGVTNPLEGIEKIRNEHFDLLILDYIMEPMKGDKVVEKIREFNNEIYILLLTGHQDLAPPLETLKILDIQGYCEKSDRFDQFLLLIESGIKSVSQMRTVKRFREGLNQILKTIPRIYQLQPMEKILDEILAGLKLFVTSENAFVIVDNTVNNTRGNPIIFKGAGIFDVNTERFMEILTPSLLESLGNARTTKQMVKLDKGVIFPLINEVLNPIGTLYVELNIFDDGIKLLEIYSSQAALALNNALLHLLVDLKNEELNRSNGELRERYMETVEVLGLAVDAKDVFTSGHSERVAFYALVIGELFNLSDHELELLRIGGFFHDIGKIGISDEILFKAGSLDEYEYQEIKKHPAKGAHILSAVSLFKEVVPLVKYHHERLDGSGYPDGLKGDKIPFLARILAVADAFDAMTSDRRFRIKLKLDEAKKQLLNGSGTQFDAEVVNKFIDLLENNEEVQKEVTANLLRCISADSSA
jgi:putative nucleotidyltransferase with HDIG domain